MPNHLHISLIFLFPGGGVGAFFHPRGQRCDPRTHSGDNKRKKKLMNRISAAPVMNARKDKMIRENIG